MSIATLKRKTASKYNNVSVSVPQFSINGGHRSQGWVGQTMLSRSFPRTPMRGPTARGSGGCCGFYPQGTIIQSGVLSTNNPNVIKPSVLDNDGMIATHYRWITRPAPYTSVKPDVNHHLNNQSDYISQKGKCAQCATVSTPGPIKYCPTCAYLPTIFSPRINTAQSFAAPFPNTVTKAVSDYVPVSEGEYVEQLTVCCVKIDREFQALQNMGNKCGVGLVYNQT